MVDKIKAEADAVADRIEKLIERKPQMVSTSDADGHAAFVVVPAEHTVKNLREMLDAARPLPQRRKGTSIHRILASLIGHVNRFKNENTAIFADPGPERKTPVMVALLNYNPAGPGGQSDWGDHRAKYTFPLSDAWQEWTKEREPMNTAEFAEFLENRVEDIADPAQATDSIKKLCEKLGVQLAGPAAIINVSRGIAIRQQQNIANAQNLQSGEVSLTFETTHTDKDGAPLKIPAAFLINVQVFENGVAYPLLVRLRYRLSGSRVTFSCQLYREDLAFDHAFNDVVEQAIAATQVPVSIGVPE